MGDTKVTRHRLQSQGFWAAAPMGRTHAAGVRFVQVTDQQLAAIHRLDRWTQGLQAHGLSNQCPADETQASAPFDVAAIAHAAHGPASRVNQRRQRWGTHPVAGPIHLRRRAPAQGFVRTFLIVLRQPAGRMRLHRAAVGTACGHHFPLVTAVELFVRRVVARSRPPGELDSNAQPQPPDRQARESQRAFAAKRRTIVHADGGGQSPRLKQAGHYAPHGRIVLVGQEPQTQTVTAELVTHRQGLLPHAIGGAKPAFEIHRPDLVRPLGHRQARMRHRRTAPGASGPRAHPAGPLQPALNRAHTG